MEIVQYKRSAFHRLFIYGGSIFVAIFVNKLQSSSEHEVSLHYEAVLFNFVNVSAKCPIVFPFRFKWVFVSK